MSTRRQFIQSLPAVGTAFAVAGNLMLEDGSARAQSTPVSLKEHFHPKGKAPSRHTLEVLKQARSGLPFADTKDFEEQKRGLIAPMTDFKIIADAGHVAWDMERFQFLDKQDDFDSIHPSLLRISKLNNNYGLYEVIPGIYQVRGFDISDITFIRGKTGWIVYDTMVSREVVRAAWKLFQQHVGQGLPVSAVIYSHTHPDHWGGVRAIVDEADVRSGKVPVIAPVDFMDFTVSENVYAGNAMNRRLFFQYGLLLPAAPHGYVGQGLGQAVSAGAMGLIAPTRYVEKPIEEFEVDGLSMIFQNTPNTEAPREMNTYIPDMKALWMAENVTATVHNIYTLRGAQIRDPLGWSKYIGEALYRFGLEAEVMFASRHWPRWGNARIQEILRAQRDVYAHLNNQVLHFANRSFRCHRATLRRSTSR
jgi:alkyl sulfatase BDS1-like metallo-beta-lactamase superfamily hydrolase